MLRALLLCALAGVLEATTLKFTFTAVRNDNPKEDIALSELVVFDAGGNSLAIAAIAGGMAGVLAPEAAVAAMGGVAQGGGIGGLEGRAQPGASARQPP